MDKIILFINIKGGVGKTTLWLQSRLKSDRLRYNI